MLIIFTLIVIAIVAYAQLRNGLFSAAVMLVQVLLAGLVAFNWFEPIANWLEDRFRTSAFAGCEDLIALTLLFVTALGLLRAVTNRLAPDPLDFPGNVQLFGAGIFGALTGYLAAGFLVAAVQTLPLEPTFFGFEPRATDEPFHRSFLPPDRVWLALMRHAGAYPLAATEDNPEADAPVDRYQTFDRDGTYELRYLRYRRQKVRYVGELDRELYRSKK